MSISRRSILKAFAASFAVPIIQLRPDVPDEKLLRAFCSEQEYRSIFKPLEHPFGIGDLTYASDRYALCRAEIGNRIEVGECPVNLHVKRVWDQHWNPVGEWKPMAPEDWLPTVWHDSAHCVECGGRRVSLGNAFPNFNDPAVDAELHNRGYDIDDNSVYDKSCPSCLGFARGALRPKNPNVTVVLGVPMQTVYLKRIAALPNVKVCRTGSEFHDDTILFRADGFEGMSKAILSSGTTGATSS